MATEVTPAPSGTPPPSSRPTRTRTAVLDATAALLTEGGLAAATIDAIRDRSGVSKTTIYKHWPNRLCVAVDAFADLLAEEASLPDSGGAREDLRQQIRHVAEFYGSSVGRVFAQLLAASLQDDQAAQLLRTRLLDSRRLGIAVLWGRATARGEAREDVEPDLAMDMLFGPVMWRFLLGRAALSNSEIATVVDSVLR